MTALTSHHVGPSEPSNTMHVVCPPRPPPPHVMQQPSYKKGTTIVAFEKPTSGSVPYGTDIIMYRYEQLILSLKEPYDFDSLKNIQKGPAELNKITHFILCNTPVITLTSVFAKI